ncbi:MAG: 2-C-methyl-D-erythritol 4-phosphate cytidylyltransferase [Candidatus Cryptobacteroides sp.]
MNIALLTAGGVGARMGNDIPKQFMPINGVPAIIYTLSAFQKHPEIDAIAVVCLEGWTDRLDSYSRKYGIDKLRWIFTGGENNQASIHNGVAGLIEKGCSEDDVILVHDGVRPLVSARIISDNISTCMKHGYCVTGLRCKEAIMRVSDGALHGIEYTREELVRTQTPHTYRLGIIRKMHDMADAKGICGTVASCMLAIQVGIDDQHLVTGSEINGLKLTNPEDVELFKAMLMLNPEFKI